jgi:hypothetical protein
MRAVLRSAEHVVYAWRHRRQEHRAAPVVSTEGPGATTIGFYWWGITRGRTPTWGSAMRAQRRHVAMYVAASAARTWSSSRGDDQQAGSPRLALEGATSSSRVDVRPTGDPKLRVGHASNAASRRSVRVDVATSAARTLGGRGRATSVRGGVRRRRASCVHGAGTRRRCRCASAMTWLRRRRGERATVSRTMRASDFTSERIVERATCERANASDQVRGVAMRFGNPQHDLLG